MSVLYNLEPLKAIELFYDGEKNGVWNGDFIKNEKEHGLTVPAMLREFLEKYAYLDINKGQVTFFHPDHIRELSLPVEDGEIHIMVIGKVNELFLGIELGTEELDIAVGAVEDERVMWGPSNGVTLAGMMRVMFVSTLFKSTDKFLYQGAEIDAVLKKHGAAYSEIVPSNGSTQHTSINFDEENGAFLVAEYNEQGGEMTFLHVVPRKTFEQRKAERFASVTLDELNSLFEAEFYGNAQRCDFNHALEIKLEIVKRLEQSDAPETELAEHYALAGRCLWALNRLDEAADYYGRSGELLEKSGDIGKLAAHYHSLGCFYADTKQWDKSAEMFGMELSLRLEHTPDNVYDIGMVYRTEAENIDNAGGDPDRVIELCELALEQFQKNPRDSGCKYETARVQQLRGKARRRKKELQKNAGQ